MAYTDDQMKRINYLRASVRLQAPDTETDPAYKFTDDELYHILDTVTPAYSVNDTIDTLPNSEFYFVMLLAKKEIYYRLASSTAPFYPLSAEGAKLEKNVRFDHYLDLIKVIQDEYESLTAGNGGGNGADDVSGLGTIETFQTKLWGESYKKRYYEMSDNPSVSLEVSAITSTSVNLDWTKQESTNGNHFLKYLVYFGTDPIYDEYSIEPMNKKRKPEFVIEDVRRTKLRLTNLLPDTTYYVLVASESRLGLSGFSQVEITTKAEVTS